MNSNVIPQKVCAMKHSLLLVTEEQDSAIEVIRATLAAVGIELRSAKDNAVALDILADWTPQLILIDLSVGSVPTGTFVSTARALRPFAEIVLVSNRISSQVLSDGLNITRHIRKPIQVAELLSLIREPIKSKRPNNPKLPH